MRKYWSLFILFCIPLLSQNTTILQGKIFDQSSQEVLTQTNLVLVKNQILSFSDDKGFFEIEADELPDTLLVQRIGYETQKIPVTDNRFIAVGLVASDVVLEEVVLKAYKGGHKYLETPCAVSVLNKKLLTDNNQLSIVPALNRATGVFMHSGALNTNRLTIRGIGARSLFTTTKIRAYFNEIPLSTGEVETTIEDIDVDVLERIEVLKGPSASLYGANLGGVVQLIGKKATHQTKQLKTHTTIGSFGQFKNSSSFQVSNKSMNLNISNQYLHSDGYRENNAYDRQALTALGSFYVDAKTTLNIVTSLIDLKAFIPSSLGQTDYETEPTKAAFTWGNAQGFEDYQKGLIGLGLQYQLNKTWSLSTNLFTTFKNSYELRPFNILKENNVAYGTRNILSKTTRKDNKTLKVSLGMEGFLERYNWQTFEVEERTPQDILSNNEELRRNVNVFGQVDFTFNKTNIVAGLNFSRVRYELTDFFVGDSLDLSGTYSFAPQFSPRISLSQKLNLHSFLYATLSHGYSPPSLSETLTPDGQINPDIQPETGFNYELGYRGTYLQKRFFVDASVFYMPIRNLIVAKRIAEDQFQGQNAGKSDHIGLEVHTSYVLKFPKVPQLEQLVFDVSYTYADYRFKEFVEDDVDFAGKALPGIAPHHLRVGMDWQWKFGLYGNVQYRFLDKMPLNDANDLSVDGYQVVDCKLGFERKLFSKLSVNLYGGVNNVFDAKYASMVLINATAFGNNEPRYYYPALPINFYGGLVLSLTI